jgi:hypothetical protein
LDVITYIEPPKDFHHRPEVYDEIFNIDYENRYFEFVTNESENIDTPEFRGTDVYYKIYNNYSKMLSERTYLENLSNDDDAGTKPQDELVKRYCLLNNREPLISNSKTNKNVLIRLTDYQVSNYQEALKQDQVRNAARIMINNEFYSLPVRVDGKSTFNFGRDGENDNVPKDGDIDVNYDSTTTEEGIWYVCMFAVGVGTEVTLDPVYSNILYLGTVVIDANSYNN